jgi:beta-N-acetylhexosaminidase
VSRSTSRTVKRVPRHSATSKRLSGLGEQVGQLLVIGFDGTEMTSRLASLLTQVQPGGVILFARNIVSPAQTHKLLKDCQALSAALLFRCVDLEGGRVDRFRNAIGPSPSAADVFATVDKGLFRKHGHIIGDACHVMGFNVDFAPALDLAFEVSRSVMSSRAVSDDPKQVVLYAREFLRGLRDARVLGSGKHFPGLGEGKLDSHHELPVIQKSWKKLWSQDLYPYRALRRDLPFAMVSHGAFPAVTQKNLPASLSRKWITDILRRKIGFRGLVVSDDLEMGGVQAAMPTPQAAVEHIRAGGDIALVCHKQEYVLGAHELLIKASERDSKFARRVAESARRLQAFKKKHAAFLRMPPAPADVAVQRLALRIWEFSEQVRLETIARQGPA